MKEEVLEILQCPQCSGGLRIEVVEEKTGEIRRGGLVCSGDRRHRYPIVDGIIRFAPTGVGKDGKPVSDAQKRKDVWHEEMTQRYWRAARYPWVTVTEEPPPN